MSNDIERRVERLEEIYPELQSLVTDLRVQIAKIPACPAPGSCLSLAAQVERMTKQLELIDTRLSYLEKAESKISGGLIVIVALGSIMSAIIGYLIAIFKR